MSTSINADQTFAIRPLADTEFDQVSGGNAVLAVAAAATITGLIVWTIRHPPVTDGIRAALGR